MLANKIVTNSFRYMQTKQVVIKQFKLRNMCYWMMMVVCVSNFGVFIYRLLIDIQNVKSMWELGVPAFVCLMSGVIGIMCEHRPRITEAQKRFDDRVMTHGLITIVLTTLLAVLILFLS